MADIIFKREQICDRLHISKEIFYRIAEAPHSPFKQISGVWAVNLEELADFVREYPQKKKRAGQK